MALALADSAFNQILAALVESGSFNQEISEIDLTGGGNPVPITAGLFALIMPEFGQLDPALQLRLRIAPTMAPVLSGDPGPQGEIAEFVLSHMLVDVISGPPGLESLHGRFAIDLAAAFDLTIEAGTGNLVPAIGAPDPGDILITLLDNPLCLDEGTLQLVLGLQPTAVEVSRVGDFLGIFLNVVPAP
jgi:hypothetical protein